MNRKQKLFYAVAGFLIGNIIFASLIFGFSYIANHQSSNKISFDEALEQIQSKEIKKISIKNDKIDSFNNSDSDLLVRLFQILFWLFLISPPIIVVLLLVIISKMNRKDSMK